MILATSIRRLRNPLATAFLAVLLIEVPHLYCRAARADPMHWHLIGATVHLHHFSLLSLQLALASSGCDTGSTGA